MKCRIEGCENETEFEKCPECMCDDRRLNELREKTAELIIEEEDLIDAAD